MRVAGVDERMLESEQGDAEFLVFIYEGGDRDGYSWSVDSYVLPEARLTDSSCGSARTCPPRAAGR